MSNDEQAKGKNLAIDLNATSASPTEPAFLARPKGAPVYHGFPVLEDVRAEEFTFGAITDFEAEPTDTGDAFVIAPDGSRAGLVWEVSATKYFEEVRLLSEIGGECGLSPYLIRWTTALMLARICLLCYPT